MIKAAYQKTSWITLSLHPDFFLTVLPRVRTGVFPRVRTDSSCSNCAALLFFHISMISIYSSGMYSKLYVLKTFTNFTFSSGSHHFGFFMCCFNILLTATIKIQLNIMKLKFENNISFEWNIQSVIKLPLWSWHFLYIWIYWF